MNSFKTAFVSMVRNLSMSIASITLVILTMLMFSTALIFATNTYNLSENVFKSLQVNVYVKEGATQEEKDALESNIKSVVGVASVNYSSKDQELKKLLATFEDSEIIFDYFKEDDNPLMDVFIVQAKDSSYSLEDISSQIETFDSVNNVNYGSNDGTDSLITTLNLIQWLAVLVTFALLIVTIFLISNTIKLSINAKREEITIMRLVGATNWTIRGPFLAEGFIIGLIGSLIALMFSGFLYNYAFHMDSISFLASSIIDPYYMNTRFLIFTPLIGILIGVCGSYNAIRSYLKV